MAHLNVGAEKRSAVCAALLSATALLAAAPASADATDDAFVAALAKQGIAFPDNNTATAIAHTVCAGFDKTDKSTILVMKLLKDTDLSLKQSSYFVGAAISGYCPQYRGRTDNSVTWLNPRPPLK
jgi:uncharacterized membrane protein